MRIRLISSAADSCFLVAVLLVIFAVIQGFSSRSTAGLAVILGMVSSIFWLVSAGLPIYSRRAQARPDLVNGLSCIAAGATGGAVMASVPAGWREALLLVGIG